MWSGRSVPARPETEALSCMTPAQETSTTVTTGDLHLRQAIHPKPTIEVSRSGLSSISWICESPETAVSSVDLGGVPQPGSGAEASCTMIRHLLYEVGVS